MSTIIDTIQEIIRHELRNVRITELGLVDAVNPHSASGDSDNYGCDVRLKNSGLLLKHVPVATGHIGTAAIPNIGDLVLVGFDKGDVNQPVIIGRLYNDADRAPLNDSDEVIFRLPLAAADDKTIKAAIRNHQDNSPPREMIVEMPPKITVRMNDGTVQATAGKSEMTLDQTNATGGTVIIMAGQTKITMNQDGDVIVEAAGAMTLKANDDISIEGMNVNIKGQLQVNIEAQTQASFKGNTSAIVDGGASATLQGATIAVNGMTSFSV
ncbi:MAG TPA: phage baseplate assembly protein V [Terriglobia bacterium]|nr:phage baseplate assembly protein V [Terriglobia bacterium]